MQGPAQKSQILGDLPTLKQTSTRHCSAHVKGQEGCCIGVGLGVSGLYVPKDSTHSLRNIDFLITRFCTIFSGKHAIGCRAGTILRVKIT